jgi:ATP-binding cassette subfamily C (CFTR/MRP) protein 1
VIVRRYDICFKYSRLVTVGTDLFLGFWTASSFPAFRQADYIAVYAALGLAAAIFSFLLSLAFA